jgi:hypothetical protein
MHDYQKNIKDLEVYFYFDSLNIIRIVEGYCSGNWNYDLPENISREKAIEALMDWLWDNCAAWYGADLVDSIDYLTETCWSEHIEEVLLMKKAHEILEGLIQ